MCVCVCAECIVCAPNKLSITSIIYSSLAINLTISFSFFIVIIYMVVVVVVDTDEFVGTKYENAELKWNSNSKWWKTINFERTEKIRVLPSVSGGYTHTYNYTYVCIQRNQSKFGSDCLFSVILWWNGAQIHQLIWILICQSAFKRCCLGV